MKLKNLQHKVVAYLMAPESNIYQVFSDNGGQTMQGLIDIESLLQNHAEPENYFKFQNEK